MSEIKDQMRIASRTMQRRDTLRGEWQEIWSLTAPDRYIGSNSHESIQTHEHRNIFDSTAVDAVQELVDEFLVGMFPQDRQWIQLTPGIAVEHGPRRDEFRRHLEAISYSGWLHINASNFHGEMAKGLLDYFTVGPLCFKTEEADSGGTPRFCNYPIDTVGLTEGRDGRIAAVYAEVEMQAWEIMRNEEWFAKINDRELRKAMIDRPDGWHMLWSMTWPKQYGTMMRYALVYKQRPTIVFEDRDVPPMFHVPRFAKTPNSPWGRGLGTIARADVLALNRARELWLQGFALEMLGQYTGVADSLFDPFSYQPEPNLVISVDSNATDNPSLRRLDTASNIDVGRVGINDMRNDVRNMFRANRFGTHGLTPPTATELNIREQVLMKAFGGALPTFINELVIPMFQRVIQIIHPELGGFKIDRNVIDVVFTAPIPQAQKVVAAQGLVQFSQAMAMLGQLDPAALAIVNWSEVGRELGEQTGIPARLFRTPDEAEELIEQGMAGQQMMAQQQAAIQAQFVQ